MQMYCNDFCIPVQVRYKETLATVGALGRLAAGSVVPVLTELVEKRISRLHGQINRLVGQGNRDIDRALSNLYDDLHWLLLIAGNVLTLGIDTQTPKGLLFIFVNIFLFIEVHKSGKSLFLIWIRGSTAKSMNIKMHTF